MPQPSRSPRKKAIKANSVSAKKRSWFERGLIFLVELIIKDPTALMLFAGACFALYMLWEMILQRMPLSEIF